MKNEALTEIKSALVIKYILVMISSLAFLFAVTMMVIELIRYDEANLPKIFGYGILASLLGLGTKLVTHMTDPARKEKEREELFASIRKAMKADRTEM